MLRLWRLGAPDPWSIDALAPWCLGTPESRCLGALEPRRWRQRDDRRCPSRLPDYDRALDQPEAFQLTGGRRLV